MSKPKVIVILGPTASGKTSFAIEIAKQCDGEIVSADSMQIYKGMDIATAKPSLKQLEAVPHHMVGFLDVKENFSVASYKKMATQCIDDIIKRGKTPLVVGGTGLYIDTLVNNTEFFEQEDNKAREVLEKKCEEQGIEQLYKELEEIDPTTAKNLHLNDTKRIIRALEVYYCTGKTMTEQRENSHLNESKYDFCMIGLTAKNRQNIYSRIDERVDFMVLDGLIEEARQFFELNEVGTVKQAIGYKELKDFFDGEITLDDAIFKLKMQTRRYAKRQLTWFRRNQDINWLYIDVLDSEYLLRDALQIINKS